MSEFEQKIPTLGDYLVRRDFNPSGNPVVDDIKEYASGLIDAIERIEDGDARPVEAKRGKALAKTKVQEASFWAVYAATAEEPPAGMPGTSGSR